MTRLSGSVVLAWGGLSGLVLTASRWSPSAGDDSGVAVASAVVVGAVPVVVSAAAVARWAWRCARAWALARAVSARVTAARLARSGSGPVSLRPAAAAAASISARR